MSLKNKHFGKNDYFVFTASSSHILLWSDIWNVSYIELQIWNQVSHDHRSFERNLSNCEQKPEKVRTSTGFEPVTSNEPVRNGCEVIYEIFHMLNCGFEIKLAMIIAVMSWVQTPLKSWLFQASVHNCLNCVQNCDDHGLLDIIILLLVEACCK